jgi:hypothetical protein
MAKDEETLIVPDANSGQPVKVEITASHSLSINKKLVIVSMKGEKKPLLIQTPKNGGDPAYIWGCKEKWFSDDELIPLVLFLKKSNMEVNYFKNRIKKILEGVSKDNRKCVKIIRSYKMDVSEIGELLKAAAAELEFPLRQKLKNLQQEKIIAAIYQS